MWTTWIGRGQDERAWARGRSKVYMADRARRDIWEAREDLEAADGVVCWCVRRNFTCKVRAAWAGSSTGYVLKLFPAVWHDHERAFRNVDWLLRSMYDVPVKLPAGEMGVCSRCCSRHHGRSWGRSDIIMVEIKFGAQQIIFMWKSIVKRHDIQVGIELSQDLLARAS